VHVGGSGGGTANGIGREVRSRKVACGASGCIAVMRRQVAQRQRRTIIYAIYACHERRRRVVVDTLR